VKSLEDIGEIVVKNINGIPVYIKNVADVRFGSISIWCNYWKWRRRKITGSSNDAEGC
jgi:hypothetical protein